MINKLFQYVLADKRAVIVGAAFDTTWTNVSIPYSAIFYNGETDKPLDVRLQEHLGDSVNDDKHCRINEIGAKNVGIYKINSYAPDAAIQELEQADIRHEEMWTSYLLRHGCPLTNQKGTAAAKALLEALLSTQPNKGTI